MRGSLIRFVYVCTAVFAAVYVALALSGVFFSSAPRCLDLIYSIPLVVCSLVFVLAAVVDLTTRPAGRARKHRLTLLLSLALMMAGYWTGGLMSYRFEAVITEGQEVSMSQYPEGFSPYYVGKYARIPDLKITLEQLMPSFTDDKRDLREIEGEFALEELGAGPRKLVLSSGSWRHAGGVRLSIDGFGYSPRYVLRDSSGRVMDSSFVYLNLFPLGTEDYFRLLSPLTYYIRYYDDPGQGRRFGVRIARNRDLVYRGNVSLGEEFSYESVSMSFPEVRSWTILRVEENPGIPFILIGIFVMVIAGVWKIKVHLINRRD